MKTLYSCGCSFMTVDTRDTGITSFLDLYAHERGLKHVSLARSGATNLLIRLQIEEAIRQNADYIVISATSSDRINIPIPGQENKFNHDRLVELSDIEYQGYRSASEQNVQGEPKIISDSINNWTTDFYNSVPHDNFRRCEITPEIIEAMKYYVAYLHEEHISQTQDYFIIAEGLRKLISLGKQFVFCGGPLTKYDWKFIEHRMWKGTQPWSTPYGFCGDTINHNPQPAHDEFCQHLLAQTPDWKN